MSVVGAFIGDTRVGVLGTSYFCSDAKGVVRIGCDEIELRLPVCQLCRAEDCAIPTLRRRRASGNEQVFNRFIALPVFCRTEQRVLTPSPALYTRKIMARDIYIGLTHYIRFNRQDPSIVLTRPLACDSWRHRLADALQKRGMVEAVLFVRASATGALRGRPATARLRLSSPPSSATYAYERIPLIASTLLRGALSIRKC